LVRLFLHFFPPFFFLELVFGVCLVVLLLGGRAPSSSLWLVLLMLDLSRPCWRVRVVAVELAVGRCGIPLFLLGRLEATVLRSKSVLSSSSSWVGSFL